MMKESFTPRGGQMLLAFCLAVAVAVLCWPCKSLCDIPKSTSTLIHSDPTTFLTQPSFEIEPWFAAGVTNNDRSPEFVQRLRDVGATNAVVQGFLGMLLVEGDGMPCGFS